MPVKEELSNLLDPGRVFDGAEALEPFVHNTHFVKGAMPECVVRPKNTDEIQEIVRWANDSKTPLIPVSSGAPHARGSSTALLGGVAMDLSEMNRILAVDRDYRYFPSTQAGTGKGGSEDTDAAVAAKVEIGNGRRAREGACDDTEVPYRHVRAAVMRGSRVRYR